MSEWTAKQWRDRNDVVIPEFRARGGQRPNTLILTTKGAKTGREHTTPLVFLKDGDRYAVFASKGGSRRHPAWYHNLVANPDVKVEAEGERFEAKAIVAEPAERDRLYAIQSERMPNFAEYQAKTERRIPVIILERA
jgi:deazaflavin-dependent oxidoreductase (nitroreductase family)